MDAIVYSSNTGFTEQYAKLLSQKTGLPAYPLKEAQEKLAAGSHILYMGWLMAGTVNGYKSAAKRFDVRAICGVGMGATGSQVADVRKANKLDDSMPVFTLQGGFDLKKLHGVYKLMMTVMKNTAGKSLAKKENKTPEEETMLGLMMNGGSCVSEANLSDVLSWVDSQKSAQ